MVSRQQLIKSGFTLIELIIVMTIIGILTSLIYPSYIDYITRTRRSDGQTALMELANQMEQYYLTNNTYQTATIGTGGPTDVQSQAISPEGWYSLSITEQTDCCYTLKATPIKAQGKIDQECQSLTFNNEGVKGVTQGPAGTPKQTVKHCW